MFCLQQSGYLDYPWCNDPYCTRPGSGQGGFYSFDQKFVYYLPTKNVTARKTIITSIFPIAFVTEWTSIDLQDFLFLLLFLINYLPSKATLRLPHSSSMNISLGKSIEFPIPSISIPSCSSSSVLTLFEGFPFQ